MQMTKMEKYTRKVKIRLQLFDMPSERCNAIKYLARRFPNDCICQFALDSWEIGKFLIVYLAGIKEEKTPSQRQATQQ